MSTHRNTLLEYKDKVHIYHVLTNKAGDFFGTLRSFVNAPIVVVSSMMGILNSSFDATDMKIPNIVLNCITALMVSLIANFKIVERANNFKSISLKFLKLHHYIDDKLASPDIDIEDLRNVIRQYDELLEQTDRIPGFIKRKVYKIYSGKKYLPSILCDLSQDISPGLTQATLEINNVSL